jgi:hypothetical protein
MKRLSLITWLMFTVFMIAGICHTSYAAKKIRGTQIKDDTITAANMDPATLSSKKAEFSKTATPTVNDDGTSGYEVGSRWIDTTNDKEYVCVDSSTGAAAWIETTGGGGPITATYITQIPDAILTNEQPLNALPDCLLKHVSGVIDQAVAGTDYLTPAGTETLTNKIIDDDTNVVHADSTYEKVRNVSGSPLTAGTPVYASGYNAGQDRTEIEPADANVAASMPAMGIVEEDRANNTNGHVIEIGVVENINTTGTPVSESWSVGDMLYISTTVGTLTNVRPTTNGDLVQFIATVTRSHATLGRILVQGAGRTNDIPNNLTMVNAGAFRTGTSAADIAILAAYDVDGASYIPFATLTANNDPTFDLNASTSIGGNAIADASDNLGFFSTTTSAQLAGTLSNETGTLQSVFSDSPTFTTLINLPNLGLHILDTNGSHDLIIAPGSDITADRTLTLTTGDSDRTITLSGNPTLDDWFDQSVKSGTSPTFDGANITGISAANVSVATGVGSPTIDQVQEYLDNTGSSGFFLGFTLSDGGAGTLDVAAGSGLIRTTADSNAPLVSFKASASSGIAVPDDTAQYVYVDDTGAITLSTNEFLEAEDNILIGVIVDEGGAIETVFNLGVRLDESIGQAGRFMRRAHGIIRDERQGGLIFGETGTRNITLTAGHLWWGRSDNTITALDTSISGGFDTYSIGGQEATGATQWPNAQYDNAGTLTTMANNRWAVLWFYIELDGHVLMVYGRNQYNSESEADEETAPTGSLPPRITASGTLAARLTFQKSAGTAASISSAFTTTFVGGLVSAHPNLTGLVFTSSGHTGAVSTFAGFDGAGAATEYTEANYLLTGGTRPLAGPWDMGSQALTNVNIDGGTLDGITTLQMPSGDIGATGARITKGWFVDLEVTNSIAGSITGNASTVTTNANLTGPITSIGNATSIASQTGTGSTFVVDNTPTLITPVIGIATGTSLDLGGTTLFASRQITVETGGGLDIDMGNVAGDTFSIDSSTFAVRGDTGKVGIGTLTPTYKLDVQDTVASFVMEINNLHTTGGLGFLVSAGDSNSEEILRLRDNSGTNMFRFFAGGNFTAAGDVTPDVDNTGSCGTAALTWNDHHFTLSNGADYCYQARKGDSQWRTLELQDYIGYPSGIAIDNDLDWRTGNLVGGDLVGEGKRLMKRVPVFAVTNKFIEFNGVRITAKQWKNLANFLGE